MELLAGLWYFSARNKYLKNSNTTLRTGSYNSANNQTGPQCLILPTLSND